MPNAAGTACVCPQGKTLKRGKCEGEDDDSVLDRLFHRAGRDDREKKDDDYKGGFHFGIGVGGGQHHGDTHPGH